MSAVDPTSAASNARLDALTKEAEAYKARIDAALKAGFTYNPENDAAYKSMQVLAQKNAEVASKGAMETMNDRGILNSTVTSDRLGQIQQTAQDQVTAAIPGLEHDAYGRYMDKVNSLHSLWGETMTQAQTERSFGEQHNQWATSRADQNYQWNKSFEETQKVDGWNHDNQIANQEIANQNYGLSSINNTISENNYLSKQSTQNAIADIVQFKNADAAMGYLRKNAAALRNNGVDLSVLIAQIVKMWPKSKKAAEALSFSGK